MTKNSFKKKDLSIKLKKKMGFSLSLSEKIVEDLISIISYGMREKKINLKNFGSFKTIDKKERIGRNPKTKESFTISKRKSIKFKPSRELIDKINKDID